MSSGGTLPGGVPQTPPFDRNGTVGALLIGALLTTGFASTLHDRHFRNYTYPPNSSFYGITLQQTVVYYLSSKQDAWFLKAGVGFSLALHYASLLRCLLQVALLWYVHADNYQSGPVRLPSGCSTPLIYSWSHTPFIITSSSTMEILVLWLIPHGMSS